jgi:hypothetical protein
MGDACVPTHWTYRTFKRNDDLFQGDIIAREPLLKVLGQIHAYFCDPKYLVFIIVTQTCDLVLRGGGCKARHISLAVIRSLALLPDVLPELCGEIVPGVFRADSKRH